MKFLKRTFLLLILVNGLLLYTHYIEAGEEIGSSSYQQEIEVMKRLDGLHVIHHFTDLPLVEQQIMWPEQSVERSCYPKTESSCERLSEDKSSFIEGEIQEQSIMYKIPSQAVGDTMQLYEDVFTTLKGATVISTQLHITDETGLEGQWLNGLTLVGEQNTEHIKYAYYRGYGDVQDLLWQQKVLPLTYKDDYLSIYGEDEQVDVDEIADATEIFKEMNIPHHTIIVDGAIGNIATERLLATESLQGLKIIDNIIVQNVHSRFNIAEEDRQLAQFVTSLLLDEPIGDEKSVAMYETIEGNLSTAQLTNFINKIKQDEQAVITASLLDDALAEVVDHKVSYFSKNSELAAYYPLFYEDKRPVYINGEEVVGVHLALKDGKVLYPAALLLNKIGFEKRENEQSIYIESDSRKYRFPKIEPFYVFNERRYNVTSTPFESIAGEHYFQEALFIRIFLMEINKTEEKIDLQLIKMRDEE